MQSKGLKLALDFNYSLKPRAKGRAIGARQVLFYSLLLSSLLRGSSLDIGRARRPLMVITRAPYRFKLSRHQLTLSRSLLCFSFIWPKGGPALELSSLSSLGALLLTMATISVSRKGLLEEWWT